jgi:hypothetical protein
MKSKSLVIPQKLYLTEYSESSTPRIHFCRALLLKNPSLKIRGVNLEPDTLVIRVKTGYSDQVVFFFFFFFFLKKEPFGLILSIGPIFLDFI